MRPLDGAGDAGIFHVATIGFAPAGELTLVDGVLIPYAGHIVHPNQTTTWTETETGHSSCFYYLIIRAVVVNII